MQLTLDFRFSYPQTGLALIIGAAGVNGRKIANSLIEPVLCAARRSGRVTGLRKFGRGGWPGLKAGLRGGALSAG
jgi:hypothetical protein